MKVELDSDALLEMVCRQLASLFPLNVAEKRELEEMAPAVLPKCEKNFSHVRNKCYSQDGAVYFNPFHGCQWGVYLYYLSRTIYESGGSTLLCDKLYALNKTMLGADLFYGVQLPDIFTFDHPLGTVMGRANYGDYFFFLQGCTVGNNKGVYPTFGSNVFMYSNSKVLGDCNIGDDVVISANAYIKDTDIPSGSLVFGQSPNLIVKTGKAEYARELARTFFK